MSSAHSATVITGQFGLNYHLPTYFIVLIRYNTDYSMTVFSWILWSVLGLFYTMLIVQNYVAANCLNFTFINHIWADSTDFLACFCMMGRISSFLCLCIITLSNNQNEWSNSKSKIDIIVDVCLLPHLFGASVAESLSASKEWCRNARWAQRILISVWSDWIRVFWLS